MGKIARMGWARIEGVQLPPGWELREDEDCLWLYAPNGSWRAYGTRTPLEVIENDAIANDTL